MCMYVCVAIRDILFARLFWYLVVVVCQCTKFPFPARLLACLRIVRRLRPSRRPGTLFYSIQFRHLYVTFVWPYSLDVAQLIIEIL